MCEIGSRDRKVVNGLGLTPIYTHVPASIRFQKLRLVSTLQDLLLPPDFNSQVTTYNKMKASSNYNFLPLTLVASCAFASALPLTKRDGGRATFYNIG